MTEAALQHVASWLACPHCAQTLQLEAGSLTCPERHSFDLSRQGYVNLLGRAAPRNADTAAMVAARERFLSGGWYRPIATAIADRLAAAQRIAEAGAGSAYYLSHAVADQAYGLATDVSVPASRRGAKAHPRVAAIVADTWAGLPVLDGVLDAVLCVFAPRNPAEFRRVLSPTGVVLVVAPEPEHLQELRQRDALLEIRETKHRELMESFRDWHLHETQSLSYEVELSEEAAADLVLMGPNAFHGGSSSGAVRTTVAVRLWQFTPSSPAPAG